MKTRCCPTRADCIYSQTDWQVSLAQTDCQHIAINQSIKRTHSVPFCNSEDDSAVFNLVIFLYKSSTGVILQVNNCPAATTSLFVDKFLSRT